MIGGRGILYVKMIWDKTIWDVTEMVSVIMIMGDTCWSPHALFE